MEERGKYYCNIFMEVRVEVIAMFQSSLISVKRIRLVHTLYSIVKLYLDVCPDIAHSFIVFLLLVKNH